MLDFLKIATRPGKGSSVEVYPKFIIKKSEDLMIRGGDFYAVWVEDRGLWSTDEMDVVHLIDRELDIYTRDYKQKHEDTKVYTCYMQDADSGSIDSWHKYCQKRMRDSFHMLDEKLIFSNAETNKKDYASKRLSYPLEQGSYASFDKLISTLYSEEERHKLEWAIGSIVSGDSKTIQKFMVLYGAAGTGKSTILNIIQLLFEGYYSVFDAKSLGSAGSQFALEAFKNNPLVAIQHDGDLSKIEDNTRLNSLVSHELMTVNEKFKGTYENRFKCFLFMGTNRPVKITDAKSGLIRRLIDVTPSGNKLSPKEYKTTMKQVGFELGAIAYHCQDVYLSNPGAYDDYMPVLMMGASNDFYNYVIESFSVFQQEDGTTLKAAWEMYKTYCEEAKVSFPLSKRNFKEELRNYFWDYEERYTLDDGTRVRSYYSRFRTDKFESERDEEKKVEPKPKLIQFDAEESIFDKEFATCFAQYATAKETPMKKWDNVSTTLKDIDTRKLHYIKVPENHIVIDFDIKDRDGNKSFEINLEEASKWPPTYTELSKSGGGIHLHYNYTGDPTRLSRVYSDDIEVKVFTGNSSLRRRLTKCNDKPIATISSGLPLKGEDKLVNFDAVKSEKGLRTLIKRNLVKEIHPGTKPSIDFIHKILEDAYKGDLSYDVSDMRNAVIAFAANSSHHADYCLKLVDDMKFKSEQESPWAPADRDALLFYDIEVFPNLFLVNWKLQGKGKPVIRMINPKPAEIEELLRYNLIGFNNRDYDNHMLYARWIGYDNEQLYNLSKKLISKDKQISRQAKFGEAFNLSYTDVYDFCVEKKSLKKWEIDLGIHHQELGLDWDKPVPKELWPKVSEYCDNDVIATEAVFDERKADFMARKIQVELVKLLHGITDVTVNDTTNILSAKIIFGNNRNPQSQFNWRDLSQPVHYARYEDYKRMFGEDYEFRVFDENGLPTYQAYNGGKLPDGYSILPFWPEYRFTGVTSFYMDEEIKEGGRVYAEPGAYSGVWDGDVLSQHPHSMIFECIFGPEFTRRFKEIVQARAAIKHKDFEFAGTLLGGALKPYLVEELADALAQALKIIINSIYGMTIAKFANAFRDPRNKDNIVAKRGNLFMSLLKREVQKLGYTVAHIKTDSIKIPNADDFIIDFVTKFGKEYGYSFETEANFDRFCLVNDSVYIAKFKDGKHAGEWSATGAQFAVPYVFKKLFSKEQIEFDDICETKSVQDAALILDMNEGLGEDEHEYQFVGKVGRFCPIKPGCGGGELLRLGKDKNGNAKYSAATGSKGYRWLEAESVRGTDAENNIDYDYYNKLVDGAVDTISKFCDFGWFISDEGPLIPPEDKPPWED